MVATYYNLDTPPRRTATSARGISFTHTTGSGDMKHDQYNDARDNYARLIFKRTTSASSRLFAKRDPYTGALSEPVSRECAAMWVKNLGRVIVDAPKV